MTAILVTICAGLLPGALMALALSELPSAHRILAPRLSSRTINTEVRRHRYLRHRLRRRIGPAFAASCLLTVSAIGVVAGLAAVGVIFGMIRAHWGIADFDRSAARWAADHASAGSTHILRLVTQLGGAYVIVPLAVIIAGLVTWRQRRWEIVAFLAATIGGQYLLVYIIKEIVDRSRPALLRLTGFSGPSFPSGHATAAAAGFAAFALLATRTSGRRARSLVGGAAVGLAVSVASTRVLLGVHWLTDVIAGLFLGWAWFALCSVAFGGRLMHLGTPIRTAQQAAATAGPSPPADQP